MRNNINNLYSYPAFSSMIKYAGKGAVRRTFDDWLDFLEWFVSYRKRIPKVPNRGGGNNAFPYVPGGRAPKPGTPKPGTTPPGTTPPAESGGWNKFWAGLGIGASAGAGTTYALTGSDKLSDGTNGGNADTNNKTIATNNSGQEVSSVSDFFEKHPALAWTGVGALGLGALGLGAYAFSDDDEEEKRKRNISLYSRY